MANSEEYFSTSEFLDVIHGQVETVMEADTDVVFRFLGRLDSAISHNFPQASGGGIKTAVGITLSEGTPDNLVASGLPWTVGENVVFYVVTKFTQSKYDDAVNTVLDLADELTYKVFDERFWNQNMKERVARTRFTGRAHVTPNEPNIMVYRVDWAISPKRQ